MLIWKHVAELARPGSLWNVNAGREPACSRWRVPHQRQKDVLANSYFLTCWNDDTASRVAGRIAEVVLLLFTWTASLSAAGWKERLAGSIYCDNTNTMAQNCTLALLLSITLVNKELRYHPSYSPTRLLPVKELDHVLNMWCSLGWVGNGVHEMFSGHV